MFRDFTIGPICFLMTLLLASSAARAQPINDSGMWGAVFGQGKLNDAEPGRSHLKWWFDGHARFFDNADGFNQSIVRPGVGYALTDTATIWAGYGWIHTSPPLGGDFDENRIWQQATWSKKFEPITFAFRSRLEQRFVDGGSSTGWRVRQFFRMQHDLPEIPRITFVVWDELFVHLNDTDWGAREGFDQNRLFVGFGWKFDPENRRRVEIGYLHQYVDRAAGNDLSNHILSVNYYFRR